ncbi:restriction endonuclease subunit S [Acinetobacter haemolyticus]|uniref:restriction endonuclease subunit S n=2 Tax=Acinetobacter TaxID=469 RepID=UPI001331C7E5|nr:restriction endonuclease subunit S [Acinetobacter haemolyticus]QHI18066.1 restriction endonuclease subunit S [Acinetobacter haemolyticus]
MATPKLRFKDFGEDWTAKKLSQVANLTSSKRVHLSDYVSEGIPFFRGKEITELKSGIFPKDILYISKKQYEDFKEKFGAPQNNEILMTAVGTLANTYLINTDFEFYFKDGNLIWFKDINADPNFLMILLDARKNDVLASAIGSTQKALTIANLNKLIFNFPSNEEQTKIASFLSVVDEKISQLTQKHELLSQYKQGMMQKLFSQQIRFKADDGSEFGEWEKTILGLTGKFIGGGTPSKEVAEFWQGSIPWISSSDLVDESIFNINITRFISTDALNQSATKLIPANSILIVSRVGVGKVAVTDRDICTSQDFTNLVLSNGNAVFFGYSIKSLTGRLLEMNQGTSIKGFVKDDLSNLKVQIPSLEEQTKIANFLSAIDQKIEIVAQQIEQAKQWKKGLLQQMFV